jgi:hypothetical protein
LRPVWQSIQRDRRHVGLITLLDQDECSSRLFGGWSMAYRREQAGELIAQIDDMRSAQLGTDAGRRAALLGAMLANFRRLVWQ